MQVNIFEVRLLPVDCQAKIPFVEAECLHAGLTASSLLPFVGGGHSILVTHAEPYRQAIIDFLHALPGAPSAAV